MSKTWRRIALGALAVVVAAGALLLAWNIFAGRLFTSPTAGLANTHWALASINGQVPIAGRALTLTFQAEGRLSGDSGCNGYGGRYQLHGNQIVVDQMISTLRACAEQPLNDQEAAFQKALSDATQFSMLGSQLTLTNASGSEVLVFQKQ